MQDRSLDGGTVRGGLLTAKGTTVRVCCDVCQVSPADAVGATEGGERRKVWEVTGGWGNTDVATYSSSALDRQAKGRCTVRDGSERESRKRAVAWSG